MNLLVIGREKDLIIGKKNILLCIPSIYSVVVYCSWNINVAVKIVASIYIIMTS